MNKLPKDAQQNARALKTDGYLQVKGSNGSIFAMGDTATIEQDRLLELAESLFKRADLDHNGCVRAEGHMHYVGTCLVHAL